MQIAEKQMVPVVFGVCDSVDSMTLLFVVHGPFVTGSWPVGKSWMARSMTFVSP